ncbi:MAG: hypothetical protein QOH07_1144 [Mycobacterium sp.]|jgi:hypothetical protein|nr:hypothetical protein [Mycobacterium sp.]
MLMSSTPLAYPQVISRRLTSFRVANFSVSAAHGDFRGGFDSRQLHNKTAGQSHKSAAYRDYVKIVPLVEVRSVRLGGA